MELVNKMQKKRLIILFILGFLLVFGYSLARTCIDSLFLEHFSGDMLPKAWLLTAIISFGIISIYNSFNQKYSILTVFKAISLLSSAILFGLLLIYFYGFTSVIFILYIWKEIYMVVLMETYWSFADIVFSVKIAKFTFGSAMAVCSFGGVLGNILAGPLATSAGTANVLYFLVILLFLGFLIAHWSKDVGDEKPLKKDHPKLTLGIKTLLKSNYLIPMAILVFNVQIVISLIDYAFNISLQENYLNLDMRTSVFGQVHAVMNGLSILLQLLMGPMLKFFGIAKAFIGIPLILGVSIAMLLLAPHYYLMLIVRILSKSLDYSWLRGIKEILYIPLSRQEKTQGKGLIDIFIYRCARGISSLILLALLYLGLNYYIMSITFLLVILWIILSIVVGNRYRHVTHQH